MINRNGCEFRFDFQDTEIEKVQEIWEMLVFQTVTSEFAEFDKLCGIRLLDKSSV